ncbi:MAG: hypothetical protein ACK5KP_07605 [Paludibacteraceae bacterium]
MKKFIRLFGICLFLFVQVQATNKVQTVHFEPDTIGNLKNPYMGWALYTESRNRHTDGKQYWLLQDKAAEAYAGVFYIRWKWDELEPEEGRYAWEHDSIFINLVQGALDRNLRLAFRAFVHTGTPRYVLDGCDTYEHWGKQTPYPDDGFFMEKYLKFIEAFGKKFNDPTLVDYVDSNGLGWWGEEHNIKYKDPEKKYEVHDRVVRAYAKSFDKVINVINFGVRDSIQESVVYDELKFTSRRDGYASKWFPEEDQIALQKHFPATPIIAEACYWGKNDISYHIKEEGKKIWDSWAEYYADVVDLALKTHANYLDMRTVDETKRYMEEAREPAKKFLRHGGYRILPLSVRINPKKGKLNVEHTWTNVSVGVLPNNNKNLGYKYKVAFALFDKHDNVVKQWLSDKIEVSELVGEKKISASDTFDTSEVRKGSYKLAVAIINTRANDSKDITLAIEKEKKIRGEWVFVENIKIKS